MILGENIRWYLERVFLEPASKQSDQPVRKQCQWIILPIIVTLQFNSCFMQWELLHSLAVFDMSCTWRRISPFAWQVSIFIAAMRKYNTSRSLPLWMQFPGCSRLIYFSSRHVPAPCRLNSPALSVYGCTIGFIPEQTLTTIQFWYIRPF